MTAWGVVGLYLVVCVVGWGCFLGCQHHAHRRDEQRKERRLEVLAETYGALGRTAVEIRDLPVVEPRRRIAS